MTVKWLTILFFLFSSSASARVFNLEAQKAAVYFKGDIGTTNVGTEAYAKSSGASTVFKDTDVPSYQYGGEVGMVFTSKKFVFGFGALILSPQRMMDIEGKNAAGTHLLNLNSTILGVIPLAHFSLAPVTTKNTRLYFGGAGGAGTVTVLNVYRFTAAGNALYNLVDFTEEVGGNAILGQGHVGFEFSMVDNVTMLLEGGYRYLVLTSLTHQRAVKTFQGDVAKGSPAKNDNGTERQLNLSSAFIGVGFRFYFNF